MAEGPGPEAEYRRKLATGSFEIQRCVACRQYQFYPRVICRHCGSNELHWQKPRGTATVYSTTVVRRKAEEGGDYNVAIVELDEGPRMMSRVDGLSPSDVKIGMRVSLNLKQEGQEAVVVFEPADEALHVE